MRHTVYRYALGVTAAFLAASQPLTAAVAPDTLEYNLYSTSTARLFNVNMGGAVASNGQYTLVGCPNDHAHATDAGSVKVFDSTTGKFLFIIPNPRKRNGTGDHFGSAVGISGNLVVVGAHGEDTGGSDVGSAYIFDLSSADPTKPIRTLHNPEPDGPQFDYFGSAVAISGQRVVVGAHYDDTAGPNTGSAYVYDLAGNTPETPICVLNNPQPADSDFFGSSVAIAGTKVAVGAPEDDAVYVGAGAVYLYDIGGPNPTDYVAINNPSSAGGLPYPFNAVPERFGWSIAMSAEGKLAVGSPQDILKNANNDWDVIGRVYVYDVSSGAPGSATILDYPGGFGGSDFGASVAISGNRVIVGAARETAGGIAYSGAAYVFQLGGGSTRIANPEPGPATDDNFGAAVGISADSVVVGAPRDDTTNESSGIAYLFNMTGADPATPVRVLNDGSPMTSIDFGAAVATSGNLIIVGSPGDDTAYPDAGRVFIFDRSSQTPTVPVAVLDNPTPAGADRFGAAVAVSGSRLAVSAPGDDVNGPDTGAVYIYDLSSGMPPARVLTLFRQGGAAGDDYGFSLSLSGTSLLVGAPRADVGETDSGAAFFYNLGGANPSAETPILNPDPAAGDYFGYSVSISGTKFVVGAPLDDNSGGNHGRAYVFEKPVGQNATVTATLNLPNPQAYDNHFGESVAIDGAKVVVGAPYWANTGKACVYDVSQLASNTPAPSVEIINPEGNYDDRFATTVAILGNTVVIGAPNDDTLNAGLSNVEAAGRAFAYDLTSLTPTIPVATYVSPEPQNAEFLGSAVAVGLTATGQPLAIIGARQDDRFAGGHGAVSVFCPAPAAQPQVTTLAATNNTNSGATLNAAVDANRAETDVYFTVTATTPLAGENAVVIDADSVTGDTAVSSSAVVTGLRAHTEYSVKVEGSNYIGIATGGAVTFTTLNTQPVAQDNAAGLVGKTVAKDIYVLGNDSDSDGDTLTISAVTQGSLGTVTIVGDHVKYTAGTTAGADTFTYTISDGFGGSATATVTVSVDVEVPGLTVEAIKSSITARDLSFSGTATDPNGIGRIEVRLNGGSLQTIIPGSVSTSLDWSIVTQPEQGANTVEITAFDIAGNPSQSFTQTFTFFNLRPELAGEYEGVLVPASGVANPSLVSAYLGLKLSADGTIKTGKLNGLSYGVAISGSVKTNGEVQFGKKGALLSDVLEVVVPNRAGDVFVGNLSLTVDTGAGHKLTGVLRDAANNVLATVTAYQSVYTSAKTPVAPLRNVPTSLLNPVAENGAYTVLLPALTAPNNGLAATAYPQGDGYASLTVTAKGEARIKGKLADGTAISFGGQLSANNILPVYVELYRGQGLLIGEVQFDPNNATTDASGTLRWYRAQNTPPVGLYPGGWAAGIDVDFIASKYVITRKPSVKFPVQLNPGTPLGPTVPPVSSGPTPNVVISLHGGGIEVATENEGRLSQDGKLVALAAPSGGADNLTVKFNAKTGLFNGSFTHPDNSKVVKFAGIAFQKGAMAAGYFHYLPIALSPDVAESGGVLIEKFVP